MSHPTETSAKIRFGGANQVRARATVLRNQLKTFDSDEKKPRKSSKIQAPIYG